MKTISSIPRLESKPDGSLEFEFTSEDGSTDSFRCNPQFMRDFVAQISAATFGQLPTSLKFEQKYQVAFEGGRKRVLLALVAPEQGHMQIFLEDTLAEAMGKDLIDAAKQSRRPPKKH